MTYVATVIEHFKNIIDFTQILTKIRFVLLNINNSEH